MNTHAWYRALTVVVLAVVLGTLMLSLHQLILLSDLFGLDSAHAEMNHAALTTLQTTWPWELLVYSGCAYSVLVGYRLLVAGQDRDIPAHRIAFVTWLLFGGIMGALHTIGGDWCVGLRAYLLFGAMSALVTVFIVVASLLIVTVGTRLDAWCSRHTT